MTSIPLIASEEATRVPVFGCSLLFVWMFANVPQHGHSSSSDQSATAHVSWSEAAVPQVLLDALSHPHNVTALDLSHEALGDSEFCRGEAVGFTPAIVACLFWDWDQRSHRAMFVEILMKSGLAAQVSLLGEILLLLPKLSSINLRGNRFGDLGITKFCQEIRHHPALSCIDISNNLAVQNEAGKAMLALTRENTKISRILTYRTGIGMIQADAISERLQMNSASGEQQQPSFVSPLRPKRNTSPIPVPVPPNNVEIE
eukprot:gene10654-3244_t